MKRRPQFIATFALLLDAFQAYFTLAKFCYINHLRLTGINLPFQPSAIYFFITTSPHQVTSSFLPPCFYFVRKYKQLFFTIFLPLLFSFQTTE